MARLSFDDGRVSLSKVPYSQCAEEPKVNVLEEDAYDSKISELNDVISDDARLMDVYQDYVATRQRKLLSLMNVFGNRTFDWLFKKGYTDSLCKENRLLVIKDLLYCESHLDVLKKSIETLAKEE